MTFGLLRGDNMRRRQTASRRKKVLIRNKQVRREPRQNVGTRFPTQVDLILGGLEGKYSRIRLDQKNLEMAERWRDNYISAMEDFIDRIELETDLYDLVEDLRILRSKINSTRIETFLEAMDRYPQELSIDEFYHYEQGIMIAERVLMRWGEFV